MALPQHFGIIPTGLPPIIIPSAAPNETSFLYTLPPRPYSHIVVFLLPGTILPPDTAAAVYLQSAAQPAFKFLGGIGPGKESAIFKISSPAHGTSEVTIGISIESAASVTAQMQSLSSGNANPETAMVVAQKGGARVETLVLAQRIIENAFNFLASYAGNTNGGVEVVPLTAFQEWWRKFEGRVRSDPGFLEREGG